MRKRAATGDSIGRKIACLLRCMTPFLDVTGREQRSIGDLGGSVGMQSQSMALPGDYSLDRTGGDKVGKDGASAQSAL